MSSPRRTGRTILTLVATAALFGSHLVGQQHRSPMAVVAEPDTGHLWVAEHTGRSLALVDPVRGAVVRRIELPGRPGGLCVSADGAELFVTESAAAGRVHRIDTASGEILQSTPAGHWPCAPVLSPTGSTLYLCNRFENRIRSLNLATGRIAATASMTREPIAAALTPDGQVLCVANHLPVDPADGDFSAAVVSILDTRSLTVTSTVTLPNGSTSVRGLAIAPNGSHAFVTHILARFHNPTSQLERGWVNTNALSVVDLSRRELLATVLLDDAERGAANPWGVTCSADGSRLVVCHSGTHELSSIDLPALLARLAGLDALERAALPQRLSYLHGIRRRIALPGEGPRAVVVVGDIAIAAEYYSDSLAVVSLAEATPPKVTQISLGESPTPSPERRGEMLFHDASICFQEWQSCSSCHPDGRADALNWDLLNDGFGNPKNTKSLLLAHRTPPAMITGVRARAEVAVRAGLRHILYAERPEHEAAALDAYLAAMRPVPSPHLVDGRPGPAALRGREVFSRIGCVDCHDGDHFTDRKLHDMGDPTGDRRPPPLDTPTLVEVWRTAPYLFDGRARDLRTMLTVHGHGMPWEGEGKLDARGLGDLIAYLQSL